MSVATFEGKILKPKLLRQTVNMSLILQANFVPWNRLHVDGWVFTRSLWRKVRGCGHFYCSHDDYDYNLTLNHLGPYSIEKILP